MSTHHSPDKTYSEEKKPDYTYALLMETSGEENESWYYLIRYQGNEEAIAYLEKQLDQVEWYLKDDSSTFVIETKFLVSETTAKELTKVDLNHCSFHRKFDGKLEKINLGFKEHYTVGKKMTKAFDILGHGGIEKFIDKEDIDPEDLVSGSEPEEDSEPESDGSKSDGKGKKKGTLPDVLARKSKAKTKRPKK